MHAQLSPANEQAVGGFAAQTESRPQTRALKIHRRLWDSNRRATALIMPEKRTAARKARRPLDWYRDRMIAGTGFPIRVLFGASV